MTYIKSGHMKPNKIEKNKFVLKWIQMIPFDFSRRWKNFELLTIQDV
jgi:hypothetical protein